MFTGLQRALPAPRERMPAATVLGAIAAGILLLVSGTLGARRLAGGGAPATPAASVRQPPVTLQPASTAAAVTVTVDLPALVPSVTQATATPPPLLRYRVREGDSLAAIAVFCGAPIDDVIRLNNLPRNGTIFVGQEILVPCGP